MARKRQARRCRAHCTDGRPCPNYAVTGGVDAARRRVAEGKALATFERYGGTVNGQSGTVDLLHELQRLVAEVIAFKDFAATLVQKLDADGWRVLHNPHAAATVGMWERAADRAGRLLVDVSRLGLDLSAEARARDRKADGRRDW